MLEPANLAAAWRSSSERCAIGSEVSNDVVLADKTVSRFHCEIVLDPDGAQLRELFLRSSCGVDSHGGLLPGVLPAASIATEGGWVCSSCGVDSHGGRMGR